MQKNLLSKFPKDQISTKSILILLFLLIFQVLQSNKLQAQNISISVEKEPFKEVIKKLEMQSGYNFFYNSSLLKKAKPVSVVLRNVPFAKALESIMKEQPFHYSIANHTVVLKDVSHLSFKDGNESLFHGVLIDEITGYPIDNTEVLNTKNQAIAFTNEKGAFQINAQKGDILRFKGEDIDETKLEIESKENNYFKIKRNSKLLKSVSIQTSVDKKSQTNYIDIELTNRNYLNLGQILQGTIPGVSLQVTSSTTKNVTGVIITYQNVDAQGSRREFRTISVDQFLQMYPSNGQAIINALAAGNHLPWIPSNVVGVETSTSVSSTLVPQLRGINAFSTESSAMLVVIDGFVRDGFPADYPMSNVESVRVIKDPRELQKWGPKGSNGVILVTTKRNKRAQPSINYNANIYYLPAPKFNRAKMRIANSAQFLNYLADAYDSSFLSLSAPSSFGQRPALRLLSQLQNETITQSQFDGSWDSLKALSNDQQINMMFQNVWNSNHTLSVMGGNEIYRYSIIGSYNSSNSNTLRNYNHSYNLNTNNQFNLFHNRLHIEWYLNYMNNQTRAGASFSPTDNRIDPYQLLLDNNGNYIYDYSSLNPEANAKIMEYGYKNFGSNILQDARLNSLTNRYQKAMTRLNWRWELLEGLSWQSSIYYNLERNRTEDFYDKESSFARQTIDQYGAIVGNAVNFYAPPGNIMTKTRTKQDDVNVRSSLSYNKTLGKHVINASLGGGGYTYRRLTPAARTLYGYNTQTQKGSTIFVPAEGSGSLYNFYSVIQGSSAIFYPANLLLNSNGGDSSNTRSLNWNAALGYSFDKKIDVNVILNNAISPNYGQTPPYTTTKMYNGNVGYHAINETKKYFVNDLSISGGLTGFQMPSLISSYSNTRYLQSYWNNYGIWINGATPTQQNGQKSRTVYQKVTAEIWKKQLTFNVTFNQQKITGLTSVNGNSTNYDSSSASNFFSFGLKGALRERLINFNFDYNKSPEGQFQANAFASYDIAKETYFKSDFISALSTDITVESISPMQGMDLMMGTNVAQSGNYSLATNGSYTLLPPKNTDFEVHTRIGILKDKYTADLRYYHRKTAGLNNNVPLMTDPATGLSSVITYSEISNKGVEFFLTGNFIKTKSFSYTLTLNGAYNINMANKVPESPFTMTSSYLQAYRNGYNVNNLWSYRWAGLDQTGAPQIYDENGNKTSSPDSAALQKALVYSGTTRAPWNGGIIQEASWGPLFARTTITFGLGGIMRYYIPAPSGSIIDYSSLVDQRWRTPGDEMKTDIPAMASNSVDYAKRAFITQNSTNSIQSSNYLRLQEVVIGWNASPNLLKKLKLTSLSFVLQAQNLAIWTKNKWHIDPSIISNNGIIGMPMNKIYSCSINLGL